MLVVLSAPAGTGKTSLVNRLVEECPDVVRSISYTTRKPRGQEADGVDYCFVSEETFQQMIDADEFLEHAKIYENHYGTSKSWVKERLDQGKHVVLVIDTQGAKQIRDKFPAVFIFVMPPSIEELRRRLEKRQTESETSIEERLAWAVNELKESDHYDYQIINDDFETAYQELKNIIKRS